MGVVDVQNLKDVSYNNEYTRARSLVRSNGRLDKIEGEIPTIFLGMKLIYRRHLLGFVNLYLALYLSYWCSIGTIITQRAIC